MPRKIARSARPVGRKPVSVRPSTPIEPSGTVAQRVVVPVSQSRRPQVQAAVAKAPVDFEKEYHYVFSDLRRLAVLASCIFVVLIVLSFIIR
jgi:hypothetical protein